MSLVLLFGMDSSASVDSWWDGHGTDNRWSNPENWDPNGVPTSANFTTTIDGFADVGSTYVVIDSNVPDPGQFAYQCFNGTDYDMTVEITPNGRLQSGYWMMGFTPEVTAHLIINGGTMIVDGEFDIGYQNGNAIVEIMGNAYVETGVWIRICNGTWYNSEVTSGIVNLYRGTIYARSGFSIVFNDGPGVEHGELNIWDGIVTINQEWITEVEEWLTDGKITAFGGAGTILYDFDVSNPSKTTIWAIPDFAGGNDVNLADFAYLVNDWKKTGASLTTDISGPNGVPDDVVNERDLATFLKFYLE